MMPEFLKTRFGLESGCILNQLKINKDRTLESKVSSLVLLSTRDPKYKKQVPKGPKLVLKVLKSDPDQQLTCSIITHISSQPINIISY